MYVSGVHLNQFGLQVLFRVMATAFSAWAIKAFRAAAAQALLARSLSRTMQLSFSWWRVHAAEQARQRLASEAMAARLAHTPRCVVTLACPKLKMFWYCCTYVPHEGTRTQVTKHLLPVLFHS